MSRDKTRDEAASLKGNILGWQARPSARLLAVYALIEALRCLVSLYSSWVDLQRCDLYTWWFRTFITWVGSHLELTGLLDMWAQRQADVNWLFYSVSEDISQILCLLFSVFIAHIWSLLCFSGRLIRGYATIYGSFLLFPKHSQLASILLQPQYHMNHVSH